VSELTSLHIAISSEQAKSEAKQTGDAIRRMGKEADGAGKDVKALDKNLNVLGDTGAKVKRYITGAFAGLSAGLVLRDITRTVADFSQAMATNRAVSRASADEMTILEDAARRMGATTKYSAAEAASGMTDILKAGNDAVATVEILPNVLNLASAGAIGLAQSSEILISTLSQFQLAASESARVTDVLAKADNLALVAISDLGQALGNVGPLASALNVPLETTAAALSVLGDNAIRGGEAGTGLKTVLADLVNPVSSVRAEIESLIGPFDKIDVSGNGLIDIFGRLNAAGMDAASAFKIFGSYGVTAATALASNVNKFAYFNEELQKAGGFASETAEIMSNNLANSFKGLRSAIEEAYLQVGDAGFAGGMRSAIDTGTEMVRILTGMSDGAGEYSEAANVALDVTKVLAIQLGAIAAAKVAIHIIALSKAFYTAAAAAMATTASVSALDAAMGVTAIRATAATSAMAGLRAVMVSHPIGALATILGTVGAAWVIVNNRVDEATERLKNFKAAAASLDDMANAQQRLNNAFSMAYSSDDTARQAKAVQSIIDNLNRAIDEIAESGARVDIDDLVKFNTDVAGFSELKATLQQNYISAYREALSGAGTAAEIRNIVEDAAKYFNISARDIMSAPLEFQVSYSAPIAGSVEKTNESIEEMKRRIDAAITSAELIGVDGAQAIDLLNQSLKSTTEYLAEITSVPEAVEIIDPRQVEVIKSLNDGLGEILSSIEKEISLIGMTSEQREKMKLLEEAWAATAKLGLSERFAAMQLVSDKFDELIEKQKSLNETSGAPVSIAWNIPDASQTIEGLDEHLRSLGQTASEARIDRTMQSARIEAEAFAQVKFDQIKQQIQDGVASWDDLAAAEYEAGRNIDYVVAQAKKLEEAAIQAEKLRVQAEGIGYAFGDTAESVILDSEDIGDAIERLAKDIASQTWRINVTQPIAEQLGALGGGGVGLAETAGSEAMVEAGVSLSSILAEGAATASTELVTAGADVSMSITTGGSTASTELIAAGNAVMASMIEGATQAAAIMSSSSAASSVGGASTSAKGNVFNQSGMIHSFGYGGVVSDETYFTYGAGKLGRMAENEPEAIMPLARGSSGRLGVEAVGASGKSTVNNYNISMTVNAKDAASFADRQTQRQIIGNLNRAMGRK